jgi:hypothetical protein
LLVEANEARLAALLEQSRQKVGRHLSHRAAYAVEIASWTLMNEQATWDFNFDNRALFACRGWKEKAFNNRSERRGDRVDANFANDIFNDIKAIRRDPEDRARSVFNAQKADAAVRIGKGREFVGQRITAGRFHALAREAHFLKFEKGILTEKNFIE